MDDMDDMDDVDGGDDGDGRDVKVQARIQELEGWGREVECDE